MFFIIVCCMCLLMFVENCKSVVAYCLMFVVGVVVVCLLCVCLFDVCCLRLRGICCCFVVV